jgi:hypothetical protein
VSLVETDDRSRLVLPGHRNMQFVMRENDDGSILLEPARVVTEAQYEYDHARDLQEALAQAAESATVFRPRRNRNRS